LRKSYDYDALGEEVDARGNQRTWETTAPLRICAKRCSPSAGHHKTTVSFHRALERVHSSGEEEALHPVPGRAEQEQVRRLMIACARVGDSTAMAANATTRTGRGKRLRELKLGGYACVAIGAERRAQQSREVRRRGHGRGKKGVMP
jgi:hypothetical protein